MSPAAATPEPAATAQAPLPTLEQLPNDADTLKRMVLELLATLQQERHDKDALRHRLDLLLRRLYGTKSERFNPDQLLLFPDVAPVAASDEPAPPPAEPDAAKSKRTCRPHGRRRLPDNLPRRPVHHELSAAERICICGQVRVDIGTDVSEQLDWQPASFFVHQHHVHKYACPRCARPDAAAETPTPRTEPTASAAASEATASASRSAAPVPAPAAPRGPAVVSAAKPALPIAKGLPGPGLLAHIIVSKYFDHLPLHRQERQYERQGCPLERSTTCGWMAACAELLRPLYDLLVTTVLQSVWLHTDDTPVKLQNPAPGATATARLWAYLGDRDHPYNVFDFTLNRQRDGPQQFLAHFHGYLHADAFSGYDALYLPPPRAGAASIIEVACHAHARRKFYEARGSDAARSHQALAYYRQLYELERRAKDNQLDDAQRRQLRQDLAVPILETFHTWLQAQRVEVLPKSPMAEAIGYALNNWTALRRYTDAGFLAIDNNVAEREMKRIAIGRKNWLFVGSPKGGQTAAVLFSFTSTCHRLGVEPWAYLQDVLTRLPALPAAQLADLLPDRWQAARSAPSSGPPAPVADVEAGLAP
jgi:transposase